MAGPTKAQLIEELKQSKQKYEANQTALEEELAAAHLENEQQATSIAELTASVAAAEAQVAAAAQNAHHPQAGAAQAGDDDTVPKPHGQFSLRQTIGLTRTEMADVRATVHELVARVGLDWHERFSHQDTSKLSSIYKLARKEQPILCHFRHNWVTTEILKTFMQNKRKMARRKGAMAPSGIHPHHIPHDENTPPPENLDDIEV